MVTRYGMSEQLGSVAYERDNQSFLAPGTSRSADYGEAAGDAIDAEVRAIVTSALERTRKLLQDKRDVLERAARRLLVKETLDESELAALLKQDQRAGDLVAAAQPV